MTLFDKIEEQVLANPALLDMGHYHTLPDGSEAFTREDILLPTTAHCLLGWVEVTLMRETRSRRMAGEDVYEWVQDQLAKRGYYPIPWGIVFSDEASALRVIRGRAAEERI